MALFCGVVSQFIPTVGTYIGGALPVLFAWGNRGWTYAVAVLVFIIVYQQIENLILSPRISQRTMDINAAVAFLAVLAFGSLFGRVWRVPGAAGHRIAAGHLPCVHQAL